MKEDAVQILLVEDNPGDARLVSEMVRDMNGYSIVHETCLSDGIARLGSGMINIVLLDLGLPDSNGIDTLREIIKPAGNIPVIVFTGNNDEAAGQKAIREGAQDYLVKSRIDEYFLEHAIRHAIERKRLETEREDLKEQLIHAQKMESIGRLAGGVAHDFNNMLAIINGYAEMMADVLEPADPMYDSVREIQDAGKRSAIIVRKLLAFARKQTISPVLMDLNDSVASMLKMLQRLIGENIDLVWKPGKNLHLVKMDFSQVDQILANLAVNARDAISDVGKMTIETQNVQFDQEYCLAHKGFVAGQFVMLAVSDNGCGMEKNVMDNLFEPFFTTKAVGKGTGLGLPTVYGIVKQNNGFLNVYSEPGKGTTFKIYLPSQEPVNEVLEKIEKQEALLPGNGETILVLEDETVVLNLTRIMLEKLGYTVLAANTPGEAMKLAGEHGGKIDMLITDVVMPEMSGRDFSATLSESRPGLKTIYISGYTANVIAHHGVLDEGVHFIQKPFSIQDLSVKVREVIEQE